MLIECADYLPKWVEPETSENRVFIYQGELHLIPRKGSDFPRETPRLQQAINLVRRYSSKTRCSNEIQSAIKKRIGNYPQRIKDFQHKTQCFVPVGVATLLQADPTLISPAVRSFYCRDTLDLKACDAMKYFPPENCVWYTATFTRCLYAQLMGQQFKPDVKVGWKMPPKNSPTHKGFDLGVKLACGFEILANSSGTTNKDNFSQDVTNDNRWGSFLKSLEKNGYFQKELPGSKLYVELLNRAKMYFSYAFKADETSPIEQDNKNRNTSSRVIAMLKNLQTIDKSQFNETFDLKKSDGDFWLYVSPDELDAELAEKFCHSSETKIDSELSQAIPETLEKFVTNEDSGLKGAETSHNPKQKILQEINFEPDSFGDALNAILSFNIPETDSDNSSSGMSNYDEEDGGDLSSDDELKDLEDRKEKANLMANEMRNYMEQMDKELAKTEVGKSFERKEISKEVPKPPLAKMEELNDESDLDSDDDYQPVDVDLTALSNILESLSSQQGLPGPASNLLSTMGLKMPANSD